MLVLFLFWLSAVLIGYTFVGYPAVLAIWSKVRPRPVRARRDFLPSVSLIVSAYNEVDVIEGKIANCRGLDYPPDLLELIVVTDGSDDGTDVLAARDPNVTLLHQPGRDGKMAAMNRAVAAAHGQVLVFSDANNLYTADALRELVAPLADPTVGVVTGRKAIDDGTGRPLDRAEGFYWRYEARLQNWESRIGSVTNVVGEILAVRREAFDTPPVGTINDDFAIAMQAAIAGWRIVYAPAAISLEPASASLEDEAQRRTRIMLGHYQGLGVFLPALVRRQPRLAWQVISHRGTRVGVPYAILTATATSVLMARRSRLARWLVAAQAAFYGAALAGWWAERADRRVLGLYLPYYFCQMNLASIRSLALVRTRRNQALWKKARRAVQTTHPTPSAAAPGRRAHQSHQSDADSVAID